MKRFDINCIIRVLLLSGTICLLAYLFLKTDFIAAAIFTGLITGCQIFSLIRYVSKTNRDLTRLLQSIKYSDFSQSFTNNLKSSGFKELHAAFTEVIKEFQRAKIEKEEHLRFLQTIVDHVGIGLIAFNPAGEVELLNNAAKKLLKIPRLKNIRDLEAVSPKLVQKLLELSPGGNDLVKLQQKDDLLQLSIYATGFVLHRQQLMLVAMQNIQNELEEEEMKSWQNLIRVLTHEIMNSITPIASLSSTAYGLLKDGRECEVPESINETIDDVRHAAPDVPFTRGGPDVSQLRHRRRRRDRVNRADFADVVCDARNGLVSVESSLDGHGYICKGSGSSNISIAWQGHCSWQTAQPVQRS